MLLWFLWFHFVSFDFTLLPAIKYIPGINMDISISCHGYPPQLILKRSQVHKKTAAMEARQLHPKKEYKTSVDDVSDPD